MPVPANKPAALTAAEANRIRRERAAGWLQDNPDAVSAEALDEIIARKEAAAAYVNRRNNAGCAARIAFFAITVPLVFFGAAMIRGLSSRSAFSVDAIPQFLLAFALIVSPLVAIVLGVIGPDLEKHDEDLTLAKLLRQELEHEEQRLQETRDFLRLGQPFILYLRAFSVETRAMTEAQVEKRRESLGRSKGPRIDDPEYNMIWNEQVDKDIDALHADWAAHRELLKSVSRVLPVVCLGNILLDSNKQQEMSHLGVRQVTLVKTPWWPVFVEVSAAAAVVVTYIEASTASVVQELAHLKDARRPLVVVMKEEAYAVLKSSALLDLVGTNPAAREIIIRDDDAAHVVDAIRRILAA